MAYSTVTHIKAWLGTQTSSTDPGMSEQLSDRVGDPSTLDESILTSAIEKADSVIDAKLAAAKYAVPVDTSGEPGVASFLRTLSVDIAIWYAWHHPLCSDVPERVQKAYEQAIIMLDDIVKGEAALPAIDPLETTDAQGDVSRYGGDDRQLTEENRSGLF